MSLFPKAAGRALLASAALASCAVGCVSGKGGGLAKPAAPLTPPTQLCGEAAPSSSCRAATDVEALLRSPGLTILGVAPTPGGMQGAKLMTLAAPGPNGQIVFRAKWRPHSSANVLNEPRRELAAYAVQKLFLRPHEYVVPPTVGRCFEIARYRKHVDKEAGASFPNVSCVYGILSYWLEDVVEAEDADGVLSDDAEGPLDRKLFDSNLVYRRSVSDVNLLTYLINHGDAHGKQFLLTKKTPIPRVFIVDNSIAFDAVKNPMLLFRVDWSQIQVPALSAARITQLAALTREDLERLIVVEQYQNDHGQLVAQPPTAPAGSDAGLRWVGNELKVGLTKSEVSGVERRIRELVERANSHKVKTF